MDGISSIYIGKTYVGIVTYKFVTELWFLQCEKRYQL